MSDKGEDDSVTGASGASKKYICSSTVDSVCIGNLSQHVNNCDTGKSDSNGTLPAQVCSYAAHGPLVDFSDKYSERLSSSPGLFEDDLVQSPLFDLCRGRDKEPIELTIGSVDTGVIPTQKSSNFWSMTLVGTVHWLLVPPGVIVQLPFRFFCLLMLTMAGHKDVLHATEEELKKTYKAALFSGSEWLDLLQSRLIQQNITFSWTTTRVGDVLFIPHDWSHATLHLTDSVALNQNFCSFLQSVCPLMMMIFIVFYEIFFIK